MPPDRGDDAYLWDMLQALKELELVTKGRDLEDLRRDLVLRRAVERIIEITGEAAGRISPSFRGAHPEINWFGVTTQRHILAHRYYEIEPEKLWRIVTVHGPELKRILGTLVEDRPAVSHDGGEHGSDDGRR